MLTQSVTINKLSGDEVLTLRLPNFVNSENIRMVKGGNRTRFLFEAAQTFLILRIFGGKQFQRDAAIKCRIFR